MGRFKVGNKGKPKGAKHKLTEKFKEAMEAAFDKDEFIEWAKQNKAEYYKMVSIHLPKEVLFGNIDDKKPTKFIIESA